MKKILFILLLIPFFCYPQAEKRYRSIIIDSVKALNGGIIDIKDSASFEKPVGIGGTLDASAILTITDTTRGILIPRMTTVHRDAIGDLVEGLLIYNTDVNRFQYFAGVFGWGDVGVLTGNMLKSVYDTDDNSIVNNADTLNGDIDASQIVGLSAVYWNKTQGHIYPVTITDSVGIGTFNPSQKLDVNGNVNISDTLFQNGVVIIRDCVVIADEASINLPDATTQSLLIWVDGDNEWAQCAIQADGTVTILTSVGSVINTDTDVNLVINALGAGTLVSIKNRLGSSKVVCYEAKYKQ